MKNDELDELDNKILKLIGSNARIPFLEVARECNISGAAVHQRVAKLIDNEVIKGSKFLFNWDKIGFSTSAFVSLSVNKPANFDKIVESIQEISEVVECYYSSGKYDLILKVVARSNRDLMTIIQSKIQSLDIKEIETTILYENAFRRQVPIGHEG